VKSIFFVNGKKSALNYVFFVWFLKQNSYIEYCLFSFLQKPVESSITKKLTEAFKPQYLEVINENKVKFVFDKTNKSQICIRQNRHKVKCVFDETDKKLNLYSIYNLYNCIYFFNKNHLVTFDVISILLVMINV
jgi:recombinational DNA repair protein RecR